MFDFFKNEFLNTSAQKQRNEVTTKFHSTLQEADNTEVLIQTVWKDLERLHQLPPGTLACRVGRGDLSDISVQLTVLKWSEALVLHMVALQNQLRTGLDQYEPDVDHAPIQICWQFDAQCGCPHVEVPENIRWTDVPAA